MLSNSVIEIQTDRFVLKTLQEDMSFRTYASWFQDPDVRRFIQFAKNAPAVTEESLKLYAKEKFESAEDLFFGIFTKAGDHIGNIKFGPIDLKKQCAVLGVLIGSPEWRNKGVFSEIFGALSAYLKSTLTLRTIELGVEKDNLPAIRAYQKSGFSVCENPLLLPKSSDAGLTMSASL